MAKILIVEDEKAINDLLKLNLEMVGHQCVPALTGKEAIRAAGEQGFDLMLLDVMLPDMEGFAVMEKVRDVPTIFLTARGATTDKVRGFGLGADDYIVKPFEVAELLVRVQAVLRRTHREEKEYTIGDLTIRWDAHEVFQNGERVELGESRTVDVHIQKLRRKLKLEDHIKTIYKNGYRFEE